MPYQERGGQWFQSRPPRPDRSKRAPRPTAHTRHDCQHGRRLNLRVWPVNLKSLHNAPFFQNGAKSGFEMCFGPSTLGAGAKTRLESRIKKFTPHCVCRRLLRIRITGQSVTNYKSKWRNIWIRDVFCYRIPAPLVLGVPTKTRLESSIKKLNSNNISYICVLFGFLGWRRRRTALLAQGARTPGPTPIGWPVQQLFVNQTAQHLDLRCAVLSDASTLVRRVSTKTCLEHVSNPDSVTKKFKPTFNT